MNELDIVDRLSIHRTMSQYLTGGQLLLALNCDRAAAKVEIERLRTELSELRKQQAEAAANSTTVCNVFEAFGERYDDRLSPADNVRSLIEQQAASLTTSTLNASCVPDGWKLVPVEPTEHMLNVGKQAADSYYVNPAKIESRERKIYRHMLVAAPSPTGLDNPEAPKS